VEQVLRQAGSRRLEVVGFNLPMKDLLGVGAFSGQETLEMRQVLEARASGLKVKVFGETDPAPMKVVKAIDAGTIRDFRDRHQMMRHRTAYPFADDFREDFKTYMTQLAYHYFIKRDALRLACEGGVIIATNPLAEKINYPMESIIAPKESGRAAVDAYLGRLEAHMVGAYGVGFTPLDRLNGTPAGDSVWGQTEEPKRCLKHPEDWGRNLYEQMPPQTDDVRAVRQFFNAWYLSQPLIQREVMDAMLKGPITRASEFHGIRTTTMETPENRIEWLMRQRI
jgi:hypothetical protein